MKAMLGLTIAGAIMCACSGNEEIVIDSVSGTVTVDAAAAGAGMVLASGGKVVTGPGARCVVRIGDGIAVRLEERAVATIRQHRRQTRINLERGALAAVVRPGGRLTVGCGSALVGTRGAAFFSKIETAGRSYHCVCNGRIHIVSDGFNRDVSAARHKGLVFNTVSSRPPVARGIQSHDDRGMDALAALVGYAIPWGRMDSGE